MQKFSKKYLDIHYRGKSDKIGIFAVVTSCFIFDEYIFFSKIFLCLVIKISISTKLYILLVIKNCQVSLVVIIIYLDIFVKF